MSSGWQNPDQIHSRFPDEELTSADAGAVDLPEDVFNRIVQQVREICETISPNEAPIPEIMNQLQKELGDFSLLNAPETVTPAASFQSVNSQAQVPQSHDVDSHAAESQVVRSQIVRPHRAVPKAVPAPVAPETLAESGIAPAQIIDLTLKFLYLSGAATPEAISRQIKLPSGIVAEVIQSLLIDQCLDVILSPDATLDDFQYQLTEQGRVRARDVFLQCRYVGPAPVSLEQYEKQCAVQTLSTLQLSTELLETTFSPLVLSPDLLKRIGAAVCNGQSILLHGPSGNGKTAVGNAMGRLIHQSGGSIFIPYAISVENQILSLFDPSVHRPVESQHSAMSDIDCGANRHESLDQRWREIRRPFISVAGELTMDLLQPTYHSGGGYFSAPLQMKANGGLLFVDNFGRQSLPMAELMNRWLVPLETKSDLLTLKSGKKIAFPFQLLVLLATNLRPENFADIQFLRRIRHKIELGSPTEAQFREIFRRCCESRQIRYDDWITTRLLTMQYDTQNPPKASDPRDLLDIIEAICRFRGEQPHLGEQIVIEAFQECLGVSCGS
ncbi:ATPase [Planctomicrobium sp. SH527]|uniref:ATPase n=1 Tax=Planctomicrobium sp. SH527 TaxID=3448123 RepID=UPI003F5AFD46